MLSQHMGEVECTTLNNGNWERPRGQFLFFYEFKTTQSMNSFGMTRDVK